MNKQGLIQVYTGNGKGKTTAAVGLACRATGQNLKVCFITFLKEPKRWNYGELKILKKLGVKVYNLTCHHPHFYKDVDTNKLRKDSLKALDFIKDMMHKNKYDVIILDEIFICLAYGFLKEDEILEIMDLKPKRTELVLTGRNAPNRIVRKADLVSEIKKIKHPFDLRIKSRKGIEY